MNDSHTNEMVYEHLLMLLAPTQKERDKMRGTAGEYRNVKAMKRSLKKSVTVLKKRMDELEIDERLCRLLTARFARLIALIGGLKTEADFEHITIEALWIISYLLGFDHLGRRNVIWERDFDSFINQKALEEGKDLSDLYDQIRDDHYEKRRELVRQLKRQKYTTAAIADILNTSDYRVQQLLRDDL